MKAMEWLNNHPLSEKNSQLIKQLKARAELIRAFFNCAACGQALDFEFEVSKPGQEIQEQACCHSCQSKTPKRIYRIH